MLSAVYSVLYGMYLVGGSVNLRMLGTSWKSLHLFGKPLGVILAVWQGPSNDFGYLTSSSESFWLPAKVLGGILADWQAPRNDFSCLENSWESLWPPGKLLKVILAVWEASGIYSCYLASSLGIIFTIWQTPGSHFGCPGSS